MFARNSRYAPLPTVGVANPHGEGQVAVVKLRPLPPTAGEPTEVRGHDQLDAMAEARYGDATRYWHVADANSELEAGALTRRPGRVIAVPKN